jgi:hypothetical protein
LTAAVLFGAVVLCLIVANMFPNCVLAVYSGATRFVSAALPLRNLSNKKPRLHDVVPCRSELLASRPVAEDQYFPTGVLDCDERMDAIRRDWYSKYLRALGEPSLFALSRNDPQAETYRFLWLRSFHRPVSIRLVMKRDRTGLLISKMTSEAGGLEPGKLIRDETTVIGKHDTGLFAAQLLQFRFWDLPARGHAEGIDGAEWILEAVTDGHYQIVDRWSPPESDPIRKLGMTLMVDLARMHLEPRDVY